MIGRLIANIRPFLEVRIAHDHLTLRRRDGVRTVPVRAPFSCSHSLVSDIDILEHAMLLGLKQLDLGPLRSFPVVTVAIEGNRLHWLERMVITDAFKNAGASEVSFDPSIIDCQEKRAERDAFVQAAMAKR